ncbi:MAG: hypothetical protein M0R80_06340 [Proteobacteria bacterium]|jgi:hypothetical protein|nr:hypothetical protein [Pseudomonadota bacterium]
MRRAVIVAAVVLASAAGANAEPKPQPRYLDAVRQELARIGIEATCEAEAGICSFRRRLGGIGIDVDATVACSDRTNTVYVAIPRFLPLAGGDGPSLALARRLLELNRRLVTAKLEWDPLAGSIRISTVVGTDSTFDRKAFRSQVLALFAAAERLLPELEALAAAPR